MRPPPRVPIWERTLYFLHFFVLSTHSGDKIIPIVAFYRRNLPHLQRDFKPHFITFVSRLRHTLPDGARDITLSCCRRDHGIRYTLHVAVVMPDHVHLILTPMIDEKRRLIVSLVEIMRSIKGASARAFNRSLEQHGPVWQEESFDHVLRSSENLDAKIDYLLQNPVRAGLAKNWQAYPWLWRRPTANPYAPPEPHTA